MEIITAQTPIDIQRCTEVISVLRPQLKNKNIWDLYRTQMEEGYRLMYIFDGNQALAFAGFRLLNTFHSGKTLYIDDLCTLEQARRRGLGSLLLDKIFEIAFSKGCDTVSLDSGHQRFDAHRLYLNKGFIITSHHFVKRLK